MPPQLRRNRRLLQLHPSYKLPIRSTINSWINRHFSRFEARVVIIGDNPEIPDSMPALNYPTLHPRPTTQVQRVTQTFRVVVIGASWLRVVRESNSQPPQDIRMYAQEKVATATENLP